MTWLREPDTEPIPGYRLVEPLGTGGFGEVWKCVAPGGLNKAIKFVYGNLNTLDDDSAKAEQEFKALDRVKAVRHPFVLSMDRIEVVDGELLIVMELADESLYDVLLTCQKAGRPGIPRDRLVHLLADAAEGLDHLIEKHALQHLDVKPKNLFVVADRVKVADFGLVKHLERQSAAGLMGGITPVYAAPETFTNKISKHSDQYSLGVVYVELLTGQRPFTGKNIRQLAMQHMAEAPDLSRLPEADRPAVARALAKNPDDRFPSCLAFVRALAGGAGRADVTHGDISLDTPPPVGTRGPGPTPPPATPAEPRHSVTLADLDWLPGIPARDQTLDSGATFGPEVGVLRPAVLIGVGSFGRKALQQIRCRLLDRVGELSLVPCLRFVSVDPDPDAARTASAGPADAALLPEHRFAVPLQPVTAYRRRHLDQLLEWLPREKLYAIPRSLRVNGSRALGRLAFSDGYLRFVARLSHEVTVAAHPESVAQSAAQAGLTVRTSVPAVYVFASASGGTGGMLLDIGHAVRKVLARAHAADAPVTAFVFAGAPDDPTSPPAELANVFATVTELNHYADPDVTFAAQYGGPEGPKSDGHGLPFDGAYLLPLRDRSPAALRDCLSRLAGYVAHDLTTPLGAGLEKQRKRTPPPGRTPFRGFGTFGVWYPRGLLLRSSARQACAGLLRRWVGPAVGGVPPDAQATISKILTDPRLAPEFVQEFVADEAAAGAGGNPVEKVGQWATGLAAAADAAARKPDPTVWAVATWDHARELLGLEPTTDADSPFRRGKLSKALDAGVKRAAEAWQNEFADRLRALDELPGPRVAAAEAGVAQLLAATQAAAVGGEKQLAGFAEARLAAKKEAQTALAGCEAEPGGFGLFGGRSARALRAFADRLRAFAEIRVREDMAGAAVRFYRRLGLWLAERQRESGVARERVGRLADLLEAPLHLPGAADGDLESHAEATLTELNTVRVVLPFGEDHLDRAAAEVLARVPADELLRLEDVLTKLVINPRGGLIGTGKGPADLGRHFGGPLVEQATAFLAELLPAEDVTAVELSAAEAIPGEVGRRVQSYLRAAAPAATGPAAEEKTFVVLPDTDAGLRYAAEVAAVCPAATAVPVPGAQTDLLFCREQGWLRPADVFGLLEPCWEAYQQACRGVETSPHARFDVADWLPLTE